MKSTKYNKPPVAKNATTQTFNIGESLRVELGDCSTKYDEYFGFDFVDSNNDRYETYMNRDKLRGLAVFILNYLENN